MAASGLEDVAFEVGHGFLDAGFDRPATSFYFSHKHGPLDRCDAEISQLFCVGLLGEFALGFLRHEECRQFAFYNFKDEADVLANQFIVRGHFIAQSSERAPAGHCVMTFAAQGAPGTISRYPART